MSVIDDVLSSAKRHQAASGHRKRDPVTDLAVTTEHVDSTTVVYAIGPVDTVTAPSLQEPLLRAVDGSSGKVRLDLAQVPYLSSAGLRVLLLAAKALQKRGERLQLANVPSHIHTVLNIAGFTSFIDVVG